MNLSQRKRLSRSWYTLMSKRDKGNGFKQTVKGWFDSVNPCYGYPRDCPKCNHAPYCYIFRVNSSLLDEPPPPQGGGEA